ncbi:MAG: glycosyltransferase family 2 protein [Pseudomonadota bacterium]
MRLCAILLNYFGHQETIDCINCLAGQPLERIVVVENSGDASEENILRSSLSGFPNVELIASGSNLGFAGGVNFALKRMLPFGFDAFLLLNNDTLPPVGLIQKLLHGADAQSLDLASPIIYCHPEQAVLWSKGSYYNVWTGLVTSNPIPAVPGNFFYLPGCCLLIRRCVFESIGFFDEAFFMYGEDVDFCHRAAGRGFRMGIIPDAAIYHKTGSSAGHNSFFYEHHVNRAHLVLSKKNFSVNSLQAVALCLKIIFLGMRALLRTARYGNLNSIRGYMSALYKTMPEKK